MNIRRLDLLDRLWETHAPLTQPALKELHRRFGLRDAQEAQASLKELQAGESVYLSDDGFVSVTDKGLKELGFVRPRLERQRKMLRALRQRRRQNIENNVWRTAFDLGELSKIVGLTLGETAELLHILLREEYIDGSLDLRGTPSVTLEGLTRKGLEEIDELSASAARVWSSPGIHVAQNKGGDVFPPTPENVPPADTDRGTVTVRETVREIRDRLVDQGGSLVEGISPIITALSGFVAVLVALAYPVGLIVLWMQLSGEFTFGFWRSLHAASMASTTMVVGNVPFVLFWALLSPLLPMWVWYAYTWQRTNQGVQGTPWNATARRLEGAVYAVFILYLIVVGLVLFLVARDAFFVYLMCLLFPLLAVGVWYVYRLQRMLPGVRDAPAPLLRWIMGAVYASLPLYLITVGTVSYFLLRDEPYLKGLHFYLCVAFLLFALAEVVFGGYMFRRAVRQEDLYRETTTGDEPASQSKSPSPRSRYGGMAIVYVCSIAAGMVVAGLQDAALPIVELQLRQPPEEFRVQQQAIALASRTEPEQGTSYLQSKSADLWTVRLLGNRGSYWYVIDVCNNRAEFLAIPNDKVNKVSRFPEGSEVPESGCGKSGSQGETDDPEPFNNPDPDDPEPVNDPDPGSPEPVNNPDPDDPEPTNDPDLNDPEPINDRDPDSPEPVNNPDSDDSGFRTTSCTSKTKSERAGAACAKNLRPARSCLGIHTVKRKPAATNCCARAITVHSHVHKPSQVGFRSVHERRQFLDFTYRARSQSQAEHRTSATAIVLQSNRSVSKIVTNFSLKGNRGDHLPRLEQQR